VPLFQYPPPMIGVLASMAPTTPAGASRPSVAMIRHWAWGRTGPVELGSNGWPAVLVTAPTSLLPYVWITLSPRSFMRLGSQLCGRVGTHVPQLPQCGGCLVEVTGPVAVKVGDEFSRAQARP
jgi:hypothetical protein